MAANAGASVELLRGCEEVKGETVLMQQNNSIRSSIGFTPKSDGIKDAATAFRKLLGAKDVSVS